MLTTGAVQARSVAGVMTSKIKSSIEPVEALPLFRHWIHSREEDFAGVEVYRPEGFDFPPSFGREGFAMRRDGAFIQDVLARADGTVQVRGRWRVIGPNQIGVRFNSARHPDFAFEIVAANDSALRLRFLPIRRAQMPGDADLMTYSGLPHAETSRLVDFSTAEVVTLRSYPPQRMLVVSGRKPYLNMEVELVPVVYVQQPEYWEIEVVGRMRGFGPPAVAPYTATLHIDSAMGKRGVEVVGATRRLRLDVQPMDMDSVAANGSAMKSESPMQH